MNAYARRCIAFHRVGTTTGCGVMCALLGYYVTLSGNCCPKTSVNNYQTPPHNIPEERSSGQHRSGSPESGCGMVNNKEMQIFVSVVDISNDLMYARQNLNHRNYQIFQILY